MMNGKRIREMRGSVLKVYGGASFTGINLNIHVVNLTIDALATFKVSLSGLSLTGNSSF